MALHGCFSKSSKRRALVERARQKDRDAIRLIIKQHNQRLYRIARSIVRDDSDAEDVLQEAYVHAFAGLDGFRGQARLGTWLARIVINEALGCIRRRRPAIDIDLISTNPALYAQIIPFPDSNRVHDPETTMAQSEIRVLLERAIDKLPSAFPGGAYRPSGRGHERDGNRGIVWNSTSNRQNSAVSRPRIAADGNGAACRTRPRQCLPLCRGTLRTPHRECADAPRSPLIFPGTF